VELINENACHEHLTSSENTIGIEDEKIILHGIKIEK